jgi:hypothetical protein
MVIWSIYSLFKDYGNEIVFQHYEVLLIHFFLGILHSDVFVINIGVNEYRGKSLLQLETNNSK